MNSLKSEYDQTLARVYKKAYSMAVVDGSSAIMTSAKSCPVKLSQVVKGPLHAGSYEENSAHSRAHCEEHSAVRRSLCRSTPP